MKPKRKSNRPETHVPVAPFSAPNERPGALAPDACPAPPPSAARRSLRRVRRAEDGLPGDFRSPNPCRARPGDTGRCRVTRRFAGLKRKTPAPFPRNSVRSLSLASAAPRFSAHRSSAHPHATRSAAPPSRPLRRPRTSRMWATMRLFSGRLCPWTQPLRPFFPTVLPLPDTIRPEES